MSLFKDFFLKIMFESHKLRSGYVSHKILS